MTLAFMIMSSMTMMTLKVCSDRIVIEGSPDGKSGTPTFVKSVVCYTHKCDFWKLILIELADVIKFFKNRMSDFLLAKSKNQSDGQAYECYHVLILNK